jgi:hypothetical protein
MAATVVRRLAYATLAVLYVLHNDLWFWSDGNRFLGLPIGLTYHILFTAAVVLSMWWLVRKAWPAASLDRLAAGAGTEPAADIGAGHGASPEGSG